MKLFVGVLLGLIGGSVATFWGMKALEVVDHATLDHYTAQSLADLERERDATRIFAMILAGHDNDREAFQEYVNVVAAESFEKGHYLVAGELAVHFEGDQLIRICSAGGAADNDPACADLDQELAR